MFKVGIGGFGKNAVSCEQGSGVNASWARSGGGDLDALARRGCRDTCEHREEREAMWRGQPGAERAPRDTSEVAVEPALGDEFLQGASEPVAPVAPAGPVDPSGGVPPSSI